MPDDGNTWEGEMLDEFARAFPYPATPDVTGIVAARLAESRAGGAPGAWKLRVTTAVLALLGFAVATFGASREARDAVAEFLGLAVEGERIEVLPTPAAGALPTPFPAPVDILERAREVSLDEAAEVAGFELAEARSREPLAAYVLEPANAPVVVVLRYEGFDLWQFWTTGAANFEKGVIGGRVVEEVTVNGADGYWIQGGERLVRFVDDDGTPVAGSQWTVLAPTLFWHDGDRYLRIEGVGTLEEAMRMAEGVW